MQGRIFAGLFLCSLFFAAAGDAQRPDVTEKPVWTLEFVKVTPEEYGYALSDLDDHWMRTREEAKRQGAVLSYHRMTNARLVTPGHKLTDRISIVLLTEYKNMTVFLGREELFASIREHLPSNTPPGMLKLPREEFHETGGNVFLEVPAEGNPQLKVLAKQ